MASTFKCQNKRDFCEEIRRKNGNCTIIIIIMIIVMVWGPVSGSSWLAARCDGLYGPCLEACWFQLSFVP